ncbi:hypothetical protein G7046_g5204 [Stylonectria norvegica]|nr:hypothetical protein G7046_g5204 [Stylonectria norvegica]
MATSKTGHLERTSNEPRDETLHLVKLGRIHQVNSRIRLIRLILDSPINFSPGQWLDSFVPGIAKPGGFTIASPPSAASRSSPSPYIELAIQESPGNPPAAWLWRPQSEILGSTLQVRVGGSFVFPPVTMPLESIDKVVFVAGGVGINPLMSMLEFLAERMEVVDVRVLYASKVLGERLSEVLFLERIAGLFAEGRLKGGLQFFATGSASSLKNCPVELKDKAEMSLHHGRLSASHLSAAVGTQHRNSTLVYVCGPPIMTDEIFEILTSPSHIGLDTSQVKTEKWW